MVAKTRWRKSGPKWTPPKVRVMEQLRSLCESNDQVTGMDDTPTKSAVADIDDPMQQLEHIGDTTELPLPRKKRMRKGYTDVVLRVSMAETFGTTQLRTVRVLRSHKNSLWVHEEDVPWLVSYVASELATGGVGPIIDPDGSIEDENSQWRFHRVAPQLRNLVKVAP